MIKITLPDGSQREFEEGVIALDVVKSISEGLARNAICVEVNGELVDLNYQVQADASFKVLTFKGRDTIIKSKI